jgi:hypothetical protein
LLKPEVKADETIVKKKQTVSDDSGDLIVPEEKEVGHITLQDIVDVLKFSPVGNFGFFIYFFLCITTSAL